ncbi:MAG: hypothetical protein AMJ84_09640 [Acidithiobacillales bacterium SM23_46]|nr:MAG: hypothetical protein AMJ84_09640 [Acidithiobacillales bacterium SM23_46]
MKRTVAVLSGIIVFGWMAAVGVFFLAENPGALWVVAEPLRERLGMAPLDPAVQHRVADHIRASLGSRSFQGCPPGGVEIIGALAFSIWLFAVFLGSGLWIVRLLGLRGLSRLEALAVAASLGLGVWGIGVFLLGVAGLLYPAVLVGVLIVATGLSLPVLRAWPSSRSQVSGFKFQVWRRPNGVIGWAAVALAALALAVGLIYTLTPAIQSDGLRYHLAVPQVYLREHRIVYLPFNAFSNFPFLIEMLFTLSLAVAGDLAAKMVHFECFVLCGLFVALLATALLESLQPRVAHQTPPARKSATASANGKDGTWSPLLATLVFWTTPTALLTAAWEFIDAGTALFFIAMVYALVRWHRAADESEHRQDSCATAKRRWRWITALFLGFLIGTKYTMLAMLAVVPLALLLELSSFAPSQKLDFGYWLRSSILVGVVAAVVASPWFIKNAVLTGNPVYPLAWGIFDGGEWSAENASFYLDKSSLKGYHPRHDQNIGETVRHVIATPWEATIHWRLRPELGQPGYEDHFLGAVFLLWLPLLLRVLMDFKHRSAVRRSEGPLRLLVLFALAYGALWYFTYQSNRLLMPALAILSVLVAYSLVLVARDARWLSRGATAILLVGCLYNIEWSAEFVSRETTAKPSPAAYVMGFQSRDSYVVQAFPPYAVFRLMPDYVRPGQKVLFIGEYRACYCPTEWQASDWFDTPLILHYIRSTPDNDAMLDRLLDEGVAWVFYNEAELAKYEKVFFRSRFSEDEWMRFVDFRRLMATEGSRLRQVFSQSGMYLFEILRRQPPK